MGKSKKIFNETKKPIADLGASFSSLAVEGFLRGIDIIPVDRNYDNVSGGEPGSGTVKSKKREWYGIRVPEHFGNTEFFKDAYGKSFGDYGPARRIKNCFALDRAVSFENLCAAANAVQEKLVCASIDRLPFNDQGLSMAVAHDSVPKHSENFEAFLQKQLPEILRVTDRVALIYPMAIYKTFKRTFTPESGDPEACYKDEDVTREVLEETHALYKDPEAIQKIRNVAEGLGFDFTLEASKTLKNKPWDGYVEEPDERCQVGVFTRKQ
ncbi:MAG: hypothetical protein V1664_05240 [Candidatus Uhrbacteria bacterium]